MSNNRYIPHFVRQELRREVYFGCPICGNPILEYHHIIPWSERNHNDPQHMVALCPSHHSEAGKLSRSHSYRLKKEPINKERGILNGLLGTDRAKPVFELGGNTFIDTPTVFAYFHVPIVRYRIENEQSLISVFIPDSEFWPEIEIVDNNMVASTGNFWDIEFSVNFLRFRKKKGQNFLTIDLRSDIAQVSGNLIIGGRDFTFSPTQCSFDSGQLSNVSIVGFQVGVAFGGSRERLLLPNYAMAHPRSIMHKL